MSVINLGSKKVFENIFRRVHSTIAKDITDDTGSEEFRVLDLKRKVVTEAPYKRYKKPENQPPRELKMPVDQDWPSVWPGPRTFHPASVPLPVRQGFMSHKIPPPSKYANAELMKLPNFLHLTPPAVRRHCDAIRKFCTPWPEALKNDEDCEKHFPLEVTTNDYCHSSPRIRDPKARVVSFKFRSSRLALNKHARDKFLRLVGERYNDETDQVTLITDRCPLRKQNYDYNVYCMLALFYESWKVEEWEEEKSEDDMEYYDWDRNISKKWYFVLKNWPTTIDEIDTESCSLENDEIGQKYKQAITDYLNIGENPETLQNYKEAVLKLVF